MCVQTSATKLSPCSSQHENTESKQCKQCIPLTFCKSAIGGNTLLPTNTFIMNNRTIMLLITSWYIVGHAYQSVNILSLRFWLTFWLRIVCICFCYVKQRTNWITISIKTRFIRKKPLYYSSDISSAQFFSRRIDILQIPYIVNLCF